jgi:ABC-2 type transport system permease protein
VRFREVLRYELSYRLRSRVTWIYAVVMYAFPLLLVHLPEQDPFIKSPLSYAETIFMLGFFGIVITAGIFGDAVTRDSETGLEPLFSTAPISKLDYLGGRFVASFVVNAALLAGMPLMVAASMTFPWLSHVNWAPFQAALFTQPFVLFTLPNLLVSAAVIYAIAALTKNTLAMYIGGLGLVILYIVVINQGFGSDTVEGLIDPFGIIALQNMTQYWTPAEQSTRLIGFPPILLANRAIWMGLAVLLLGFLFVRFSFVHPGLRGGRRSLRAPGSESDEEVRHAIASAPHVRRHFGAATRVTQLLAVARHSMLDILRNRVFIVLVLGTIALAMIVGWNVGAIVFDTSTWPVTHLIAASLHGIMIATVMIVLLSLIAGELVWKERDVGVGDIAAAAPTPDWVPLVGRFLALVGVLLILQTLYTISGIATQALQGYYRFEIPLYVKIMFGVQLLDYVIFAALAMAVHVVINHKNMGHVVLITCYLFTLVAGGWFRLRHNLLVYNGDSGWVYSDLNGFGPFLGPWLWFKSYWGAWALLLTVVATVFWVRSTEGGVRARLRLARFRMTGSAGRAAAVAGALILATGGFVFYNTNVLNEYLTPQESRERRIGYERAFKRYEDAPQPTTTHVTLRVDVRPERRQVAIRGTYRLVNSSGRTVDTLLVGTTTDVELDSVRFDRPATLVVQQPMRQRLYTLPKGGLAPGDSMEMSFHVSFAPKGFPNQGIPTDVVSNGAYFDRGWLPAFGYRVARELTDTTERREAGLPPRASLPRPGDTTAAARAARNDRGTELVHLDVTISTAPDQLAVTPGRLVREWEQDGRRLFRYVTDTPVSFGVPFFSARYAVRDAEWRGMPLKVFYHATHDFNLDRIIAAMKRALEYNSTHFGPYPFHELRVVEFPRYASFARAHPHTIAFGEGSAFITRIGSESRVDRTFFVVAHETAHQWWGNALRPARMKGAGMLSETLAQYSAMMALEKEYGSEMAWRLFGYDMDRYLGGRRSYAGREPPLVEVDDDAYVYYSKGMLAMYTLRDMIGEDAVNTALRRFYEKHANSGPPYPTSPELVAELQAVTPDSLQYLITDLFETITLYDIENDSVTARRRGDQWEVTLTATAKKMRADSVGNETEVPMHDLVEVGVFAKASEDGRFGKALHRAKHWIRSGQQKIVVTFPASEGDPARAGVDPDHRMIKRERRAIPTVEIQALRNGSLR